MSVKSASTLKEYFQTGAVPTQSNFSDLIDSCLIPDAEGSVDVAGTVTAPAFKGSGAELTGISAVNISGTFPSVDVAGTVTAPAFKGSGAGLTGISAANISGTFPSVDVAGTITAAAFEGSGAGLTGIPAANISGTFEASQLPPLSALSGVLASVQFPNGGSIAASESTIQLSPGIPVHTTVNAYSAQSIISIPENNNLWCCAFVAGCTGFITELHVPIIVSDLKALLAMAMSTNVVAAIDEICDKNGKLMKPNPEASTEMSWSESDGTVQVPNVQTLLPSGSKDAQTLFLKYDMSRLKLHLVANEQYVFLLQLAMDYTGLIYGYSSGLSGPFAAVTPAIPGQIDYVGCTAVIHADGPTNVYVAPNGVGIGTATPSCALEVAGTVQCASLTQTSDARLKTEIEPFGEALQRVTALTPVSFRWMSTAYPGAAEAGPQLGLVAQAVEAVFPELVLTSQSGVKAIDYSRLAAALVGAVRELEAENSELRMRLRQLDERLQLLEQPAARPA